MSNLAPKFLSSDATGLILSTTDVNYTSTDFYVYNFGTGEISTLAAGESGDVNTKWDGIKYWIFNRASGRVSYSNFSPKQGPSSRSTERKTPSASAYDPYDWLTTEQGETLLALNISNQVVVADLRQGTNINSDLTSVDTQIPEVAFRPSIVLSYREKIAVFHQALDVSYKANGLGKAFIARRNSLGRWEWQDQDSGTPGIQGIALGVTNPTAQIECREHICYIAGSCYTEMGATCVDGVDEFNWDTLTVSHIYDIESPYTLAGAFSKGIDPNHVFICLRQEGSSSAKIHDIDLASKSSVGTWDSDASYCSAFKTDRAGKRLFAIKTHYGLNPLSSLLTLDSNLNEVESHPLDINVTGMDIINE